MLLQPPGLLGRHAEQRLAIKLVTGDDGHAAAGLGPDGHVLLAVGRPHRRVKDRSGTGVDGWPSVNFDDEQSIQPVSYTHLTLPTTPYV